MTTTASTDHGIGLTRAERVALAVLAPVGPLAILATILIAPTGASDDIGAEASSIAADPGATTLSLWFGLLICITVLIGVLVTGAVARRGSHTVGTLGTVIAFLGFASTSALGPFPEGLLLAAARSKVDPTTAVTLVTRMSEIPPLAVVSAIGWPISAIGVLLLGAALARAQAMPMWAAAATIISMPLTVIGWLAGVPAAGTVGMCLLVVGFAVAGVAFLRPQRIRPAA